MNDRRLIINHWKKEQKVVDTNLSVLKKRTDSAAIHDMRVAIKKLRAFLKLYSLLTKETDQGNPLNKTEELFAVLGKQRDIEICMELIPQYEKENDCQYNELMQYLKLLLKTTKRWVHQSIQEYQKKELTNVASLLKEDKSLVDEEMLIQNVQDIVKMIFWN